MKTPLELEVERLETESNEAWEKLRQLSLKRDAAYEAKQAAQRTFETYDSMYKSASEEWRELAVAFSEAWAAYNKARAAYNEKRSPVSLP